VSGFWYGACVSFVTGAVVNEFSDLAPWLAVRVARLAARLRSWSCDDPEWAAEYREAWPNEIQDRPGKLFKLAAALWLLAAAAVGTPGRGLQRLRLAGRRQPQERRPIADPRLEKLWRQFARAYSFLFLQSIMFGVLTTLSRLVFPDLRPVIVVVTTTGFLLSLGFAQRATYELIQALRNPPGPQPPLPTSVAVWIIFDRVVELLKRARERLKKWMQLLRFTVSTMASYS
jgi:hypothetical protein